MTKKKLIRQGHHCSYKPEIIIPIARKEHFAIMNLQRYKYVTWGFVLSLLFEIFRLSVIKLSPLLEKEFEQNDNTEGT